MQPWGLSYAAGAVVAVLVLAGCTDSPSDTESSVDFCEFASEVSGGFVLSDDLLSRSASARELQNRLAAASIMLSGLGEIIEDDALRSDAETFNVALDEARVVLAGAGFEPYVLIATQHQGDIEALAELGSSEVTLARSHLVAELNSSCALSLEEPTAALGVVAVSDVTEDPVRRTEIVVAELSTSELTALLASGIGLEAEAELLDLTGYRSISALLEALRSGEVELDSAEQDVITGAIQRGDYGDDEALDRLWDACAEGDYSACDLLWYASPRNTEYERFGGTCGERREGIEAQYQCETELGT